MRTLYPPISHLLPALLAITAAGMLLAAAVAKTGVWLHTGQPVFAGWALPTSVGVAALTWETTLAVGLLLASWSVHVWVAARATFCAFALLATAAAISGATSCGCFGELTVPPWAAAAADVLYAAAFWVLRPPPRPAHRSHPRHGALLAALVSAMLVGWLAVATASRPTTGARAPTTSADLDLIAALPEAWHHGRWVICCYRSTCAHCRGGMPHWLETARRDGTRVPPLRWAFLRVDAKDVDDLIPPTSPHPHLRQPRNQLMTPWFLRLEDGVEVMAAEEPGDEAVISSAPDAP